MDIVFFDIRESEQSFLEKNLPDDVNAVFSSCPIDEHSEIPKGYENAEAVSVFALNPVSGGALARFKNLKYIFTRSVGYSHIDKGYCIENDIRVFNTPHYGDYTVAEFAFGILLSCVRNISRATNAIREGDINQGDFAGIELHSKTLGIIGLGGIGHAVERISRGFSMHTICYDSHKKEGYNYATLDELCEKSDIITLHVPLGENNYHMIDEKLFAKMKKGVVIVNTARGELIDTAALIEAIESKKVAFCALDVVECEHVLTNHNSDDFCLDSVQENCLKKFMLNRKLLSFPNVLITPHIAYDTKEGVNRILEITIENIKHAPVGNYKNMVF